MTTDPDDSRPAYSGDVHPPEPAAELDTRPAWLVEAENLAREEGSTDG